MHPLPSGYESVPDLKAVLQSLSSSLKSGFEHADTPQRAHLSPSRPTLRHSASALVRFLSSEHDSYTQQTRTAVMGLIVDTVGSHEMATE